MCANGRCALITKASPRTRRCTCRCMRRSTRTRMLVSLGASSCWSSHNSRQVQRHIGALGRRAAQRHTATAPVFLSRNADDAVVMRGEVTGPQYPQIDPQSVSANCTYPSFSTRNRAQPAKPVLWHAKWHFAPAIRVATTSKGYKKGALFDGRVPQNRLRVPQTQKFSTTTPTTPKPTPRPGA